MWQQLAGAIELGAVGTFGALMSTSLLDVTTISTTSAAVVLGIGVLPVRRVLAKRNLRNKVDRMKKEVNRTLRVTTILTELLVSLPHQNFLLLSSLLPHFSLPPSPHSLTYAMRISSQGRFDDQLVHHAEAVSDAVTPFSRFARASNTTIDLQLAALQEAAKDISQLREQIAKIGNQ